jgi:hypothetical protein
VIEMILKVLMLNRFGEIDESITFDFVPLFAMTEKERSAIRKSDSESATAYVTMGSVSPAEVRSRLASDPDSEFNNLDVNDLPKPPTVEASKDAAKSALRVMREAHRTLRDGGFHGNQHIGGIGGDDTPSEVARKLTVAAVRASAVARRLGTQRAHQTALHAHTRAANAHKLALSSAPVGAMRTVHQTYLDAHRHAVQEHRQVLV